MLFESEQAARAMRTVRMGGSNTSDKPAPLAKIQPGWNATQGVKKVLDARGSTAALRSASRCSSRICLRET
jgi:hypothetical protein